MKNLFFLLLLIITATQLYGQRVPERGVVMGQLLEAESQTPLEFATISLLSPVDSSIVTGSISDEQGKFAVETKFGTYLVKIEFIGYDPITMEAIDITQANRRIDLGVIDVRQSAEVLEEIEVVADKSEMQFDLDKRTFNIGKDLSNRGGSAEEILDAIPSINVDVEGNVSLRGSENVRILVDGKPSGLIGIGDTDGLKSLPAGMIEKVEIVTNASARYEASGTSGIINIILKKDRKKGVNGSVDVSGGYPLNYGAGLNLNARRNAINYFLNYGFRNRTGPGQGFVNQDFFNPTSTIARSMQSNERERGGISHSFRGGLDLFLTDNDIITGSILYRLGDDYSDATTIFRDFGREGNLLDISERIQDETEDETNLEYEIRYERKFPQKDRKLTAFVQYQSSEETESADYIENAFNANGDPLEAPPLQQRSINTEGNGTLLMQADYVHPLSTTKKLEFGTRISLREIGNDYLVEELQNSQWETLRALSNNFIYDEDIYAAYALFGNKLGKWSYQAGLRLEHSNVITTLEETNEVNDRSYTNLFPTAHVNYEINKESTVQVSYSRRISRPRFWYLNPFFTFSNNRNIWGGNPNLDPELTDSYEIGLIKFIGGVSLSSSVYYRHTTGVIERIARVDSTLSVPGGEEGSIVTRTLPENLSTENSYGVELTTSADINKWWRVDGSINIFSRRTEGQLGDQVFDAKAFSFQNRFNSRIKFWNDTEFQTRFWYRAPQNTTQGRRLSMFSLDLALSKEIMKKKGTLTLSMRDLFNTRKYRNEITVGTPGVDGFFIDSEFQRVPRVTTLSFNYRINQKKQRGRGDRGDYEGGDDMGQF